MKASVGIKKIYELNGDLTEMLIGKDHGVGDYEYFEVYSRKTVINSIEHDVFTVLPKTFYHIIPTHCASEYRLFVLSNELSLSGVICNYNPETHDIFIYNTTMSDIYIKKDVSIGDFYD